MALLVKDYKGAVPAGTNVVDQWIRVSVAAASSPQTASREMFRVVTGRVLVKLLMGEVTTVHEAGANNFSITYIPEGGVVADLASALDTDADAVGEHYFAEGDGTALLNTTTVKFSAVPAVPREGFVIAPGSLYWKTSASKTGASKWDVFYLPLDPGASVVAVGF